MKKFLALKNLINILVLAVRTRGPHLYPRYLPAKPRDTLTSFLKLIAMRKLYPHIIKLSKNILLPVLLPIWAQTVHNANQIQTPAPLVFEFLTQLLRCAIKLTHIISLMLRVSKRACFLLRLLH